MKQLNRMHLIQFSFWDYETFNFRRGGTAFIGPNGAGKTSLIDAVQIALIGAHGSFLQFNTQSIHKDSRSVRDYALGFMRSGEGDGRTMTRKRDEALSYITLIFEGKSPQDVVSAGICIHSKASERGHRTMGMYVLPGVRLEQEHHLEALQDGYYSPIDWNVFEAGARALARKAGREPTITSHPEAYLKELLHAIQGKGPSINHEVFLRALAQSLRLKGIKSVNDFIRENLVDAKPIDRQGTLRHIKTLQELTARIEDVRSQIQKLNDIDSGYTRLATLFRLKASAAVVKLDLQMEATDDTINQLTERHEDDKQKLHTLENDINTLKDEADRQNALENTLALQIAADPDAQAPEQARQLKDARLQSLKALRLTLDRRTLDIREALQAIIATDIEHGLSSELQEVLIKWSDIARLGEIPTVQDFSDLIYQLNELKEHVKSRVEITNTAALVANTKLSNVTGIIHAASKGMRIRNAGDLGMAIEVLREQGIESETVGSLVSVSDVRWQPAIESFLGRNRFALVVKDGRERDAVRAIRHLKRELYDVTIVQPHHLRDIIGNQLEETNIGALLTSDHPVALAYLRRIVGRMQKVDSEEELELHDRSMTMDGMLSANGGTRRIRLVAEDDLVLGAKISEADKLRLHQELEAAIREDNQAKNTHALARQADEKLRQVLQSSDISIVKKDLDSLAVAKVIYEGTTSPDEIVVPDRLKTLIRSKETAKVAFTLANNKLMEKNQEYGDLHRAFLTLGDLIEAEQDKFSKMRLDHDVLVQDIDYDIETSVRIYGEISDMAEMDNAEKALSYLYDKYLNQESRIAKLETETNTDLKAFGSERSMDLKDELGNWRRSFEWVKRYKQRLIDSQLAEYHKQSQEAREAANDAFHHDVALKLREATHRIRQEIDDLNRILKICPEFTGHERYHFTAAVSAEFRWLHEMIEKASYDDSSAQLFDSGDDNSNKLAEFLQACELNENRGDNPLEDHRLLFNFDLDIQVDGRTVDKLSKRLGVGSNGEHLIPFYVIAGATLVNAYRMKPGADHDGAALMIIDEAFHGFDAQNTFVTAQFLKSLGLQLIMAAPDTEVGKLIPVIDSYYDLWRHGPDVEADESIIKEDARNLMISDIPDINPDLVRQTILEMSE